MIDFTKKKTFVMGIINITPDSFSDGGDFFDIDNAVKRAIYLKSIGCDIIDIGAESTRPGHKEITEEEELRRLIPFIKKVKNIGIPISIDSQKSRVVDLALSEGANIINDIWGFQKDKNMVNIAKKHNAISILMHNSNNLVTDQDIMEHILDFFKKSIEIAINSGISKDLIILDPGIGFNKTHDDNWNILKNIKQIVELGYPVLLGTSRKRFIGDITNKEAKERDYATSATSVYAALNGVRIVRVHEVDGNIDSLKVADRIIYG